MQKAIYATVGIDELLSHVQALKGVGARFVQMHAERCVDDGLYRLLYTFINVRAAQEHIAQDGSYAIENLVVEGIDQYQEIPSISSYYPAVFPFENEAHDLFGLAITDMQIDFKGFFYQVSTAEPMSVITPEVKAAREKAMKVRAAAEAKARKAAAEKFMDANPDVSVSGSGNGSGKGLTAVAAGTVTIGNSDVFAETKLEADQVKNLVDHEVAVVGMGPVVSKNVTVDDLSLEQLKGIFSGQITNWKEVGGDDATIVVLNRKAGSGTRATFEAAVFGDETVDFKGDAELDKSGDVQTQMASTDNAISYLDFSHFDDSKFNAIKVEGVEPKSKNVTDDSFKIWATEHMYCSKDADEATKAFLEFMLSDDVQGKLVEEQGFIPVSAMKVVKDASGKVSAK